MTQVPRRSTIHLRDDSSRSIGEINPNGMRPLGARVLVRILPENWERPSGLYIPDAVQTASCQGHVVELGPEASPIDEMDLAPGDHVIFGSYQENTWFYAGVEYALVELSDVIARIEDDAT